MFMGSLLLKRLLQQKFGGRQDRGGLSIIEILQYMETLLSYTSVVVSDTGSGSCRG